MKYVSIDIETTGLDPKKHDIIEIGAVFDDLSKSSSDVKALPFHCYVVLDAYVTDPWCAVSHTEIFTRLRDRKNLEDQYLFLTPEEIIPAFKIWLLECGYEENQKITIAGKNFSVFDLKFLDEKLDFSKNVKYHHRMLDPSILYMHYSDETVPNLAQCLERAGMDSHVTHTAVEDAVQVASLIRDKFPITTSENVL